MLKCSCCGDQHEDVGPVVIDGVELVLCWLCQPCAYCGETGGACDPYVFGSAGCVSATK
jgi:hypothetical protein